MAIWQKMHYFSTNQNSPDASFREAVLRGQPQDGGLYFPTEMKRLPDKFLRDLRRISNEDIAFEVIRNFVGGEISDENLREICSETVDFSFPLVKISDRISSLELFHGPTLAFKDVGARFMSRCLSYFSQGSVEKTIVVVATSGDTGGAVAAGFLNVPGIEVVILYPSGKVSDVQELQLTTLGGNVTTLELHGNFDDCQTLAKRALADRELQAKVDLTSANSINVARWLPQQFYYFFALKQWEGNPPVIAVPSGNFGNLAAGITAWRLGLPVKRFIAACNANDVVPRFLTAGSYAPKASILTISNAMDVGAPSNFVRIMEIFDSNVSVLKEIVSAVSVSDEITKRTISEVFEATGYILDPHGAVGYRALADHIKDYPDQAGFFLETAHPVKFDTVAETIGTAGPVPESVENLRSKVKQSIEMDNDYDHFRAHLLSVI